MVEALELAAVAIAAALTIALAAVVLAAGPRRRANQWLFLTLFLAGAATFLWSTPPPAPLVPVVVLFNGVSSAVLLASYVFLLAETLDTPLVAPLRLPAARLAVVGFAALTLAEFLPAAAQLVLAGPPYDPDAAYAATMPTQAATLGVLVFAFAASISAWRRAPRGSSARERARWFATSFGIRDALVAAAIASAFLPGLEGSTAPNLLWPLALILSVPPLAYGILRAQLFDLDLRIKRGLSRSTVVGAFVLAFAILTLLVERATTASLGLAAGGLGVGLLLFALGPLQRLADRFADRVLPAVRADDAYLRGRKLEVYRAALEDALAHDPAGRADDPVLVELRRSLGVSREQHAILHLALRPRAAATAVPAQFEVLRELGRGGSGRALLARDRLLERHVVLKQPLGILPPEGPARERFLREARMAAQVHHPNVVAVHQVVADRDPPLLVLEYVDGESLAERLAREGPLPPAEVGRIGLDVLAGLHQIHRAGIVHRDVKPGNILLARDGTAKVTDFGVAHAPADPAATRAGNPGVHPGSPRYMSPEQARGQALDARSDLYSVALVLHEALTGALPPAGPDATVGARGRSAEAPAPLPPAVAEVLHRALDPAPARRFPDAASMAAALRQAVAVPA